MSSLEPLLAIFGGFIMRETDALLFSGRGEEVRSLGYALRLRVNLDFGVSPLMLNIS